MNIYINSRTLIEGLTKKEIATIKDLLTISNPEFYKKLEMELYHWDTPQNLKYYDTPTKDSIYVPVGATNTVLNILVKQFNRTKQELDIHDNRFTTDSCSGFFDDLEFQGKLRNYQQDILEACLDKTIGVVEAMTAAGKTVAFTKLIVDRRQPTLILVNTKELADQTAESIAEFTNISKEDIGMVGGGEFDMKPISVGIHQTLARFDDEDFDKLNNYFGQVIADEVHIVAAETFFNNMQQIAAKYKYGFSATPRRQDGLTDVIHFASGPKIHKVPEEELVDYITVPSYRQVSTDYYFFMADSQEYQLLLSDMAENEQRNQLIIDEMRKHDLMDEYCCLLCRRTAQVEYLADQLGPNAAALTSKVTKKNREKIMQQVKSGEINILVSTFGLMSTGIDVPHFEYMLYCGPIKSKTKIKQSVGRVMRQADGKESAEIIDFVDKKVNLLRNQAYDRKRTIKKLIQDLTFSSE